MPALRDDDVTGLLQRSAAGDQRAQEALFETVYSQLHEMAARRIRSERRDHTIQPTALIHETYLALIHSDVPWADRAHFFAVASRTMRRILIDYARRKASKKRQGGMVRIDLEKAQVFSLEDPEFMIALDNCLVRLKGQSERACQVVEMRAFAGLSMEDIAVSLGVSIRTVKRDWQTARLWIYQELYGGSGRAATPMG
jgi:RNA polymerase sigma factor (TIGR02999 family)